MWKDLGMALGFLTRLRLPGQRTEVAAQAEMARSLAAFPLVGLILGAVQAAAARGLTFSFSHELSALWVVGLGAWLTRGLHLDGLADVADGVGGAYEPARRLAIIRTAGRGPSGSWRCFSGSASRFFPSRDFSPLIAGRRSSWCLH